MIAIISGGRDQDKISGQGEGTVWEKESFIYVGNFPVSELDSGHTGVNFIIIFNDIYLLYLHMCVLYFIMKYLNVSHCIRFLETKNFLAEQTGICTRIFLTTFIEVKV